MSSLKKEWRRCETCRLRRAARRGVECPGCTLAWNAEAHRYPGAPRFREPPRECVVAVHKKLIERWKHPIGTPVRVRLDDGTFLETVTRSHPWFVSQHASILVEGISGGYSLFRVEVVASAASQPALDRGRP